MNSFVEPLVWQGAALLLLSHLLAIAAGWLACFLLWRR